MYRSSWETEASVVVCSWFPYLTFRTELSVSEFVSAEIVPRCFPTTTSFPSIKAESRFKARVMEDKTILPKIPFQCKRRAILYPSSKIYPRFYSLLILILLLSSKIYKADLKSKNEKKSNKKSVLEHCFIGILFCPIPSDPYQPCPYLTVYSLPSVLCKLILNSPFQVLLKIYQIYIYIYDRYLYLWMANDRMRANFNLGH